MDPEREMRGKGKIIPNSDLKAAPPELTTREEKSCERKRWLPLSNCHGTKATLVPLNGSNLYVHTVTF